MNKNGHLVGGRKCCILGGPGAIRTPDPQIRRHIIVFSMLNTYYCMYGIKGTYDFKQFDHHYLAAMSL